MPEHTKLTYFNWILFTSMIGISVGYLTIKGGTIAYGAIITKLPMRNQRKAVILLKILFQIGPQKNLLIT
jgi:hypothetical protein